MNVDLSSPNCNPGLAPLIDWQTSFETLVSQTMNSIPQPIIHLEN
jgi:hypothetical protein